MGTNGNQWRANGMAVGKFKGWVSKFQKIIFFCSFNNTICLEYSLLYGAGIDDAM